MLLDITELEPNQKTKIEIDESFDELYAHAKGMLEVKSGGDFVFVTGKLDVDIELECSRCLKKFKDVLIVNIDEKFFKGTFTPIKSKEHQMKGSDFVEELNGEDEIDLSDLIYQSIILSVPSQVLCNENCNGSEELQKYIKADENIQRVEIPLKVKNNDNK